MKARELFLQVSAILQDMIPDARRWPWEKQADESDVSLVDLFNSALFEIAMNRPDATAVTESIKLETGARQLIPDPALHQSSKKALRLLEVVQNMGSDGHTAGEPIFATARDALKTADWSKDGIEIDNYAYDAKTNPQVYYVLPAVAKDKDVWVEATYSAIPDAIASPDDALPVSEVYSGAIIHWMLYKIFAGDNGDANAAKAQHHLTAFYQTLGVKLKADLFFPVQVQEAE
ncbi:DUF6682 family protein [Halodesulfovibrio sp.]|jgi:hypothetical protein|uniref:phage adaptor protein n=1 Tax=Halodesulfovibrio sp. TaxID=1912772 RepID=UPI0025FB3AF5|nr:DUF6682 family protein [Halodesulfovibrio sp.]MCT4627941.1 hypothetical protein [Halodesulfovibrio sp.]